MKKDYDENRKAKAARMRKKRILLARNEGSTDQ